MIGRVLTNIVSAFQRDRVHYGQLYASDTNRLTTNFNGALPHGDSIVSAIWRTDDIETGHMSLPEINGRSVSVMVRAQYTGRFRVKVTIRTESGAEMSAWHVIRVMPAPYFGGEGWTNGPRQLEVVA